MSLPEEANRWKSDGRIIELDTGDQAVRQIGEGHDPSAPTFAAWLHGHGWTVNTQHRGAMRIGGKTADADDDVAALERLPLEEYALSGVIH